MLFVSGTFWHVSQKCRKEAKKMAGQTPQTHTLEPMEGRPARGKRDARQKVVDDNRTNTSVCILFKPLIFF